MTLTEIKTLQHRVGAVPDGFLGAKSIAACQAHLKRMMPKKNPWPGTTQAALTRFYGETGDESQLVNLPVEIDASNRAKAQLVSLGIVPTAEMPAVNSVLNAAAWTYVAGTLQSVLTLLYYASLLSGGSDDRS